MIRDCLSLYGIIKLYTLYMYIKRVFSMRKLYFALIVELHIKPSPWQPGI